MRSGSRLEKLPWKLRYEYGARLASDCRRLLISMTHRHCTVRFLGPVRIGPGFALNIPDRGTLIVGSGVDFRRGFVCEISGDGRVEIGALSVFTSDALIQCSTSITIGYRCVFGQATQIVDGSHRYKDPTRNMLDQGYDFRPIAIGDGVAVMSKCTIVADIGTQAFIGANSVVTRPIPAFSLALGAPARVVESFAPTEQVND